MPRLASVIVYFLPVVVAFSIVTAMLLPSVPGYLASMRTFAEKVLVAFTAATPLGATRTTYTPARAFWA
jgi:hypothetical protein